MATMVFETAANMKLKCKRRSVGKWNAKQRAIRLENRVRSLVPTVAKIMNDAQREADKEQPSLSSCSEHSQESAEEGSSVE